MESVDKLAGVPVMLNVLSRVCDSTLDHWLSRVHQVAEETGQYPFQNSTPHFLEDHRQRLWDLIRKSTPLPDVQVKAAMLVMHLDPVMRANGHHAEWVLLLRMLAVAMCHRGLEEALLLANLWRSIGRCYEQVGDMQRAKHAFTFADSFAGGQGEPSEDFMVELRQEAAAVRVNLMQLDEAENAAFELLTDARLRRDNYTLMLGHTLLAYAFIQNTKYAAGFEQAQQGFVLARALKHDHLEAQSLQYMAEACRLMQHPRRAHYYLGLVREQEVVRHNSRWSALVEQNLGSLLVDQGDHEQAVIHLQNAFDCFEEVNDLRNTANCGHALGLALGRSGRYEAASHTLRRAITTWQAIHNPLEAAGTCYSLGWVYRWAGQLEQSLKAFHEAWQLIITDSSESRRCERLKKNLLEEIDPGTP